jgi:protein-S-isoprenylcysteine O-methyltransferase Ste14
MKNISAYQQLRVYLTRILFGLLVVLLLVAEGRLETESPVLCSVLFLGGCVLAGIASLGRLWCSLYIAGYKTKSLVITGPYSICRNPLYFFSMLGGIGVGLAAETVTIPVIIAVAFMLYYPYVIRFEEEKLRAVHGEEYETYCKKTPRFWPQWSLLTEPEEYVVNPKLFKRHMFSALWFIWFVGILEFIEALRETGVLKTYFSIY